MNPISRVQARINEIETRFSPKVEQNATFAAYLKEAEKKEEIHPIRQPDSKRNSVRYEKGSIKEMLVETAEKYGVNSDLVLALAYAESGYRPDVVSHAGAVGVMQLMPETAKSLGVSDSFDAKQNIDGGVRYLKQMLNMFGGDTSLALAAYNAGPGAVQKYGGIPPYRETQSYVRNIMADLNS